MTRTCSFQIRGHKEFSVESSESQTNAGDKILRHCASLRLTT